MPRSTTMMPLRPSTELSVIYATPLPLAVTLGLRSNRTSLGYESEKATVGGKSMVWKIVLLFLGRLDLSVSGHLY